MRVAALLPLLALFACNPPAADDYVARVGVVERAAPADPIDTPDTKRAVWAASPASPQRLLYGTPGQPPLFALECRGGDGAPLLEYTRFANADPYAKAILALIGNGHVSRLKIDALHVPDQGGGAWLWQGRELATDPAFEGLTGGRQVEATVPGAGSLILNPSALPGDLVQRCRALAQPAVPASAPEATGAAPLRPAGTTDTAATPPPPAR